MTQSVYTRPEIDWDHLSIEDVEALVIAQDFVREGDLLQAEEVLRSRKDSVVHLDMLARVMLQQGNVEAARDAWKTILQKDPQNLAAQEALSSIDSGWFAKALGLRALFLAATGVFSFLALFGFLLLSGLLPGLNYRTVIQERIVYQTIPVELPTIEPEELAWQENVPDTSVKTFQDLETKSTFTVGELPVPTSEPPIERVYISLPRIQGVDFKASGSQLQVIFKEGIFPYRTQISDNSSQILLELSSWVKTQEPPEELVIIGHTDNDPVQSWGPYDSNYHLGFDRASKLASWFREHSSIPAEKIKARSAGEESPPYSNDSVESQRKNRTAVLNLQYPEHVIFDRE